jgi:hypothetical protein
MSGPPAAPCPTCGARIDGRFCGSCGEQKISAHDYSITHFAEHIFESLTHFDFKSLRAVKMLVARPGRLTRDYLDGRRRGSVGPVQLFVIVNIVFALMGPNSFRTPLSVQEHDRPFPALKQSIVTRAIATRSVAREEFRRSFDDAAGLQGKTWVFAMIPLFAIATAVLYGFRRYFFEHLIFATHVLAFVMAWILVVSYGVGGLLSLRGVRLTNQEMDGLVSGIVLAGMALYIFFGLRRVFGDRAVAAAARALAVTLLFYPILLTYRFLLFFVTIQTMH